MPAPPPRHTSGSIDWLAPRRLPDLSDLSDGLTTRLVLLRLRGSGPGSPWSAGGRALLVNAVRTADKARTEYEAGRLRLEAFEGHAGTPGDLAALYRATDHFENCVTSAARALRFLSKLRRGQGVPPLPKDVLPEKVVADKIRALRNAIEHNDEEVLKGARGELAFLGLLEDRLELAGRAVTYLELAACLRRIHECVRALLQPEA